MRKKLLIVDDEEKMRQLLKIYLAKDYQITEAANGKEAYEKILKEEYDLLILDIMMPVMDGWETLHRIKEISDVPILMLTAKGELNDKVAGLRAGADDYLVKPFEEEELLARVEALLRRVSKLSNEPTTLKYKGLVLNISERVAFYLEVPIFFTQSEFDILKILIEHKGQALTREQIGELIWGIDFFSEDRTIDSHIKNIREKLREVGIKEQLIETVWGIGYKVR